MASATSQTSASSEKQTLYDLLKISPGATDSDIRRAYRRQALLVHPDKNKGNEEAATEEFKRVSHAYFVLGDENRRAIYDKYGEAGLESDDIASKWATVNIQNVLSRVRGWLQKPAWLTSIMEYDIVGKIVGYEDVFDESSEQPLF